MHPYTKILINSCLLVIGLTSGFAIVGQSTVDTLPTQDTIPLLNGVNLNDVEVLKRFEATLINTPSEKVLPKPLYPESFFPDFDYDITIIPLELEYPEPIIRPYAMPQDPPKEYNKWYIEGGYGTMSNADALLHGTVLNKPDKTITINGKYHQIQDTTNNPLQHMQVFDIGVAGDFAVSESLGLEASANIGQSHRGYVNTGDLFDRTVNYYDVEGAIKSLDHDSRLIFKAGVELIGQYEFIERRNENNPFVSKREDGVKALGNISYNLSNDQSLEAYVDAALRVNNSMDQNFVDQNIRANWSMTKDRYWLKLGFASNYNTRLSDDELTPFTIWPDAEVGLSLWDSKVAFFGGTNLDTRINGQIETITESPFSRQFEDLSTRVGRTIYAGSRGDWEIFEWEGQIRWVNYDYYNFYEGILPRFRSDQASGLEVFGQLEVPLHQWVHIGGDVAIRAIDAESFDRALYVIPMEVNAYANFYLLDRKLTVTPRLQLAAPSWFTEQQQTESLIGLHGRADYRIGDHFGVYLVANNILNDNYNRWAVMPMVGIHGRAGLTVRW